MTLRERDGLSSDRVWALHEGRDGTLWIGTFGGLDAMRDGRLTPIGRGPGALGTGVRAIVEDAGGLWIGTNAGGLVRRTPDGQMRTFTTRRWPAERSPAVDRRGPRRCALGVVPQRRARARRRRSHHAVHAASWTARRHDARTWSLDGHGYLWMTSTRGLFRVALAELDAIARGARQTMHAELFGIDDGLRSEQGTGRLAARRDPDPRRPPLVRDAQRRGHGRSRARAAAVGARRWPSSASR